MSNKNDVAAAEEMAAAIYEMFEPGDEYLLVTLGDNGVNGREGIPGLYLVANALHALERCGQAHAEDGVAVLDTPSARAGLARLKRIRERLRKKAKAGVSYVLAYHIHDTAHWEVAWSEQQTEEEAVRELLIFVTSGMMFEALS